MDEDHVRESDAFMLRVQDLMTKDVIVCSPQQTIQEVAQKMMFHQVSSVIVMKGNQQLGIITERDMVNRVVAVNVYAKECASSIMTSNPITISHSAFYYEALSLMLLKGIKHLLVMEKQQLVGIMTLSDLLRKKNENILKTIRRIENADAESLPQVKAAIYEVLEMLLNEKTPISDTLSVITTLYDRLMKQAVYLAVRSLEEEKGLTLPVNFNFYTMGSAGRGEQFVLTDQDHFLVYEEHDRADSYFQMLGEKIVFFLERAGYERCKGLMMSSESQWRGTIMQWKWRVHRWISIPTSNHLLLASNFFSFRLVYGDNHLHEQLQKEIVEVLQTSKLFLYHLAKNELQHPIRSINYSLLSMFKFSRKSIDMKKEILFPYHHSLQILSLIHNILTGTPFERLDALMEKEVMGPELVTDLKEAINQVLNFYVRLRWQQAKTGDVSSTILNLHILTPREREELAISLRLLKELQDKIFYHFNIKV